MHDIKKIFERDNDRDNQIINMIHMSNRHLEIKMQQQMMKCEVNKRRSTERSYRRARYEWRNDYKNLVGNKRNRRIVGNR